MVRDRIGRLFQRGRPLFFLAILTTTGCLTNAEDRASRRDAEELRIHELMTKDLDQPVTARSQSPFAQIDVPPPPVLAEQPAASDPSAGPLRSDPALAADAIPPGQASVPELPQPGRASVPDLPPPGQVALPDVRAPAPIVPVQAPVTTLPLPAAPIVPAPAPAATLLPPAAPLPSGQIPPVKPGAAPATAPLTQIKAENLQMVLPPFSEPEVKIVATIGTTPIYEREVKEGAFKERMRLIHQGKRPQSDSEQKIQDKKIYEEQLVKLVERELIIDEMTAKMKSKPMLRSLKEAAAKEANEHLKAIQRESHQDQTQFKQELEKAGLTYSGLKRCFERDFMVEMYMDPIVKDLTSSISFVDVREYYDSHLADFQVEDRVKWQDLFIRVDRYPSREAARQKADDILRRARAGTTQDFLALVKEFDQGDSSDRNGYGFGEKADAIRPFELAGLVMSLKKGDAEIFEMEYGFHLIRIVERTYKGPRPFDEKVQMEIRRRLVALLAERSYRERVTILWKRANPQLFIGE